MVIPRTYLIREWSRATTNALAVLNYEYRRHIAGLATTRVGMKTYRACTSKFRSNWTSCYFNDILMDIRLLIVMSLLYTYSSLYVVSLLYDSLRIFVIVS